MEKDVKIFDAVYEDGSPSYSYREDAKTINTIMPEKIAKSICDLLEIKYEYPYETLWIGSEYVLRKIEVIPKSYVSNYEELGVDSLIMRMDLLGSCFTMMS